MKRRNQNSSQQCCKLLPSLAMLSNVNDVDAVSPKSSICKASSLVIVKGCLLLLVLSSKMKSKESVYVFQKRAFEKR